MNEIADLLNKIPSIAYWAPTLLFVLVLLFKVLGGLRRGFRKSLILTIISILTLVISYMLFLFVFRQDFFQEFLVNTAGLKKILGVSTNDNTLNGVVMAFVESKLSGKTADLYANFSEYTILITNLVVGLVYLIVTLIIWQVLYLLFYLIVYLPFFREGKYRKKKNKEYDASAKEETTLSKKQYKNRGYKRHRGYGSLIGLFRGVVAGVFSLALFGFIYFGVSGGNRTNYDEETKITYNGTEYDLTPIYEALDNYDSTGVTYLLDRMCVNGTPLYASFINLFSETTIKIDADGVNTTMYPYDEIAKLVSVAHDVVGIVSRYDLTLTKDELLDDIDALFKADDNFYNDLVALTNSIKKSKLSDALYKTISSNFASILDTLGVDNKYLNTIFKGENAITLEDLITKDDYTKIIDIARDAVSLYSEYKDNKDIKDIIINKSDEVITLSDKLQTLTVFNSNASDRLNKIINELATDAMSSISLLKNVKFVDVDFVSSGNTKGEINNLLDILTNVLDTKMIVYEESTLKFDLGKVSNVLNSNTNTISESQAMRCIISGLVLSDSFSKYIYIPSNCYDSNGIITTSDLKSLFNSLNTIVTNLEFSDENTYAASEISSEVIPLVLDKVKEDETIIDPIYESTILKSIVAKSVYSIVDNRGWSEYLASSLVLDDEHIAVNITNWTDDDKEVDLVLKAVVELYSNEVVSYNTTSKEIGYSLTNIYNLTSDDASDLINMATNSILLRSILVSLLNKVVSSDLINIYVPDEAYEDAIGDDKVLSSGETVGLMKAVGVVCKTIDLQNGDTDSMVNGFLDIIETDDVEYLTTSYIIEATLSSVLYDALAKTDYGKNIPDDLKLDDDNYDANIKNWYGEGKEFENILDSLEIVLSKDIITISSNDGSTSIDYDINNIGSLYDNGDEDVDKFLSSGTIRGIMSAVIKDLNIGYEIYLPDSVMDGDLIKTSDLKAMFKVIKVFTDAGIDFGGEDVGSSIKNALSPICSSVENKATILASVIMSGTISNAVYSIVTGDDLGITVTVPSTLVLDEENKEANMTNWITSGGELSAMLDSLAVVDLANISGISFAFKLTENDVNTLYSSKILSGTMSGEIRNAQVSDFDLVIFDYNNDSNGNIKASEVYAVLSSIKTIVGYDDLTDEQKNSFSFSEVTIEVNDVLNNKIDAIFASNILVDSMSYKTYTTINGKEGISIPAKFALTTSSEINYASWRDNGSAKGELKKMIDALKALSGDDIDVDNIDTDGIINLDSTSITTIVTSDILYFSMSDNILGCGLSIPAVVQVIADSNYQDEIYITKDEIQNIMGALKALGIDSLDVIQISSATALSLSDDDLNTVLLSYVVRFEVSSQVETNIGEVPTNVKETLTNNAFPSNTNTTFITTTEIKALITSLKALGITDFSSYSTDTSILLNDNTNISTLLASYIIWYKFSSEIKKVESIVVTDASLYTDTDTTVYIIKDEITKLVNSAKAMGMSTLDSFSFNAKKISETEGATATLASSRIMRDTITKNVLMGGKAIINDTTGESTALSLEETTLNSATFYSYTSDEVEGIINGLGTVGVESVDVSFTLAQFTALTNEQKNTILSSHTMWYYVSHLILNNTVAATNVTDSDKESHTIVSYATDKYQTQQEDVVKTSYILNLGK